MGRIIVLGGGFGGALAAQRASSIRDHLGGETVLIDRNNYLLFYPLLVEAGVGTIEARHVVVPTRKYLGPGTSFEMAEVTSVDLQRREVKFKRVGVDSETTLDYDQLVIALGSVTREPTITGLKEYGFTLKTLDDAIGLRDRGIRLLEMANTQSESAARRELLTTITVGANYTGVEFAGEYFAFMKEAAKSYPNVDEDEVGMVLIEYGPKILPASKPRLATWCEQTLRARGVRILTGTTLKEVTVASSLTTQEEWIPSRTVIWAAGIAPNPVIASINGLPINSHGYIDCNPDLSVKGHQNVWAIGDTATVMGPDGKPYAATAQTASRQGPLVMDNIVARIQGRQTKSFYHADLGSFAAIGDRKASAEVMGFELTGFIGWFLYRTVYLMKMPTVGLKFRLMADWTTELFFRNTPVQLGLRRYRGGPGEKV